MQCAQAYLNVHWSFILSFRQVNLWFKEPYVFYSCTTESDELSSSECCWKENLQLKVAALTRQPKKMVCTLSKTICWNIKKGLITKISFKIFQNLKFEGHKKKSSFVGTVVRTLFKVLMIFTWKMMRCKTDCGLDQTCNLHCCLYSQHHWLTDLKLNCLTD